MDRDELQERIRARRSGGEPYRRGGTVDDERGDYERFEPDPIDSQARRPGAAAEQRHRDLFDEPIPEPPPVVPVAPDLTRDADDWAFPPREPAPAAPPPADFTAASNEPEIEPEYVDNFDDEAYDDYPYQYDEWEASREPRSGAGAFAILGFLALGVLALLGGAVLAGVFGGDGAGSLDPSPSPSASVAASAAPTDAASTEPSAAPTGSPDASGGPIVFPDGFTAETQPCLPGSAGGTGCDSNGVSNNGVLDIWVGFQNGNANDVIGATLVAPDGSTVDGSIDLVDIGCTQSCNGWTYFPFRNLTPGTYEVEITRNGDPAASTSFEVTS